MSCSLPPIGRPLTAGFGRRRRPNGSCSEAGSFCCSAKVCQRGLSLGDSESAGTPWIYGENGTPTVVATRLPETSPDGAESQTDSESEALDRGQGIFVNAPPNG